MIDITVTVDDDHRGSIRAVAAALTDRGVHVSGVLPALGVITGSCPEAVLPTLAAVTGVGAVEQSHTHVTRPAEGPGDEGATATSRPTEPPPTGPLEDPAGDVELEREADGRYRVVRRTPRHPDDAAGPTPS